MVASQSVHDGPDGGQLRHAGAGHKICPECHLPVSPELVGGRHLLCIDSVEAHRIIHELYGLPGFRFPRCDEFGCA